MLYSIVSTKIESNKKESRLLELKYVFANK